MGPSGRAQGEKIIGFHAVIPLLDHGEPKRERIDNAERALYRGNGHSPAVGGDRVADGEGR
jgi:hypothetical protein